MNTPVRMALFLTAAAGFAALLAWGMWGLPDFGDYRGPYGDVINAVAVPERHLTNMASAVNFDYRGFDTLGEEYILFTAVVGLALLLRQGAARLRTSRARPPPTAASPAAAMRCAAWPWCSSG